MSALFRPTTWSSPSAAARPTLLFLWPTTAFDAAFVTKLPAHAIGQAAVNSLRRYGVDTSKITRGGDRVGIYFNEKGASQRGSVCIYDRANSAIQLASTADFDWDAIFEGVDWFHFTGITPALGENVVEICREACKAAKGSWRQDQLRPELPWQAVDP